MPLSPYYTKEETEAQGTVICLQLLSYPDTELGLEAWSMTSEMLGTLSSVTLNSYFMSLGYFFFISSRQASVSSSGSVSCKKLLDDTLALSAPHLPYTPSDYSGHFCLLADPPKQGQSAPSLSSWHLRSPKEQPKDAKCVFMRGTEGLGTLTS